MSEVYITEAVRTPVGVGKADVGALHSLEPVELAAHVLRAVVARAGVDPAAVEDVVLGCATPLGLQGGNIGRLAALKADFPVEVPGVQLNRMCGSGQQALHFAAQAILAGDAEMAIAGGVEMMSHEPLGSDYPQSWPELKFDLVHQGESAERVAERWQLSREELDDFSYESHERASTAIPEGRFEGQIEPVAVPDGKGGDVLVDRDQGVRLEPDREKMAQLPPVFREDGLITAGNSSQISDGAGALLLASSAAVRRHNLTPLARLSERLVVGSDPILMLTGPIPATRQILARAGLSLSDMDVIEINEAFASVVLAWARELKPDMARVNPNGGAIAHGHPLGATGAILMTKLVHELRRTGGRYGLQTMCIGHGMATASIVEAV